MVSRVTTGLTAVSGAVLGLCTFGLPASGVLYFIELKVALLAEAVGLISAATERMIEDDLVLWTAVIAAPLLIWMGYRIFQRIWTVELELTEVRDADETSPA